MTSYHWQPTHTKKKSEAWLYSPFAPLPPPDAGARRRFGFFFPSTIRFDLLPRF
jgi:hypothetical protein